MLQDLFRLRSHVLVRNSFWSFIGQIFPMIVALVTIPLLVRGLGTESFGLLTLIWGVLGYFAFFDLGLGRTITREVAARLNKPEAEDIPEVFWTAVVLLLIVGLIGSGTFLAVAPTLVHDVFRISPELDDAALMSCRWLALAIPLVALTSAARGALEAKMDFFAVNLLQAVLGASTYLVPALVLLFEMDLVGVVVSLVVVRAAGTCAQFALTLTRLPVLRRVRIVRARVPALVTYGGWLTVSNIVGPVLYYFDRFILGAMLPVAHVAYYTTPYEMVTRLLIVPGSVARVLFADFASGGRSDGAVRRLYLKSVLVIGAVMVVTCVPLIVLAYPLLSLWIGTEFAEHSYRVLQILALGVFLNALAWVPLIYLQSHDRPDLVAKLHLCEVPPYLGLLFALIQSHGIRGAAIAWTARAGLDMLLLFTVSARVMVKSRPA